MNRPLKIEKRFPVRPDAAVREVPSAKVPTPEEVKTTREAAGLSQAKAAALLYLSVKTWGCWEQGVNEMPLDRWEHFLLKVAQLKKGKK